MKEVKTLWKKIDWEIETTMQAFGIVDQSCDSNPIARRAFVDRRAFGLYVPYLI